MKRGKPQTKKSKSKPKSKDKSQRQRKKLIEEYEIIDIIDSSLKDEEKFLPLDEDYFNKKSKSHLSKKRERAKSEKRRATPKKSSIKNNQKIKIKKGVDYKKGKYNIRVEKAAKDENLEGEQDIIDNSCCVTCSNRNCIRAAQTQNYALMEQCIKDTEHISSIIEPYSISIGNALEKAIKKNDKKMVEIIFKSLNNANDQNRCYKDQPKIQLINTGQNSFYMVGVRTRKLNQTRGNKMGNDVFIMDDVQSDINSIVNTLCQFVMEKIDDPTWIDYLISMKFDNENNSSNKLNNRYYNFSNNFNLSFDSYIINAVLKGNIENVKHLLKGKEEDYNFGFNALHYQVLAEKKPENIKIKVKTSLTKKPQTNFGMTPMHIVCINPNPNFIKKLVELGGDWNVLDDLNRKPIHYAACCKSEKPLNYLLSLGALIDEVDKEKKSPLMYACLAGRINCVKLLLQKNANFLLKDKLTKNTAFHFACKNGYLDIAKYFIENTDIKIDIPGEERMTGLMLACLYGHYDLVEYLLEKKAKINKKDKFKRTPLIHAIRGGHYKLVSYLLWRGADFEQADSSNNTPLHYACSSGFKNIVEILIKAGANPNPSNDWKYTALEIGFVKNHFGIIKYLLNYVDVNTKFNLDMTLIHYSFKKINKKIVEEEIKYLILDLHYLAKYDFNQFYQDNNNYFYNKTSDEKYQKEVYQDLIKKVFEILTQTENLNINLQNKEGKTPFQLALEKNNYFFLEEILKLNPELCYIDKKDNSIFHNLIPFIFQFNIPQDKKMNIIHDILNRIKDKMSEDELIRINNSYDENGFTPLLKFMYEYHKNIHSIYSKIKNEITKEYQNEQKGINNNNVNNNNFGNSLSFSFNFNFNNNNIFGNSTFGQSKQENKSIPVDYLNIINQKTKEKFKSFLEFLLSVIKKYISLKSNPEIKVGKLSQYRNKDTNNNNNNNDIESQYFQVHGKNSILLYLMSYPDKAILKYFIEELNVPVNLYNLYKRNSLYFLIDNISQINIIEEKDKNILVKETFDYLINKGINIECIDYLGNNLFLYLSKNYFDTDLLNIFFKKNCDINKFNKSDENPLFYYMRKKDYDKVKILIEQFKSDYTLTDSKKRSLIHYLCNDEISSTDMDERLCNYLLSKKINLNSEDILGRTPIFYLFVKINDEYNSRNIDPINTLTKLLENDEVNPEHKDIYGNTPLHYACQRGSIISIISLGAKKINYDIKNKENNSPLAYSILFKKENVAISLIQQNVDIDQYAYPLFDRDESKKIKEINKNNDSNEIDLDISLDIELSDKNKDKMEIENNDINNKDKNKINVETLENKNENNNDEDNDEISSQNHQNPSQNIFGNNNASNSINLLNTFGTFGNSFNFNNNNYVYNPFVNNNTNKKNIYIRPSKKRSNYNYGSFGSNYFGSNNNKKSNQNSNWNLSSNSDCPSFISNIFDNIKNNKGIKLFQVCIKNNFQGLTHLFITKGYNLMKAIEDSFYENQFNLAKKLLIRSPYDKTYQILNSENQNLFHILGHINNINQINQLNELLDLLYSKNIPLDAKDIYGNTPLHYASENLFIKFIKFILSKYENKNYLLNLENNEMHTPFYLATKNNNINIISKETFDLLFTNKNINQVNPYDESLLDINEKSNKNKTEYKCTLLLYIIRLMLKSTTNQKNENYQYFLTKLIQNGASLVEKDSYGKSSLIYAVLENNFSFLKILCENVGNNIDKNIIDISTRKSLIHFCVSLNNFGSYENKEMLEYLLNNNFISSSKDIYNKTPLDYALEQKSGNNLTILKNKNVIGTENIDINNHIKYYKNKIQEENSINANNIPIINFEQDSKEYFNKIINSIPDSEYNKSPNLREYQSQFFELYKENKDYWDASLTKVNLKNGIYGEYMFYFIQLIHDKGKNMYIVTTQFGRIGEEGANQRSPFNTLNEAKNEFNKIFKSKTGNNWDERNNFKRIKGKYMLLTYNKIHIKPNELIKPFDYEKCPKSNLLNNEIKTLLKNITDNSIIAKAFKDSGVDGEFFNYSMLNKEILIQARKYLVDLLNKVQELDKIRNININMMNNNINLNNDSNDENKENEMEIEEDIDKKEKIKDIKDIKTLKDKTDAIIFKTNEIMELSNRYYELIPKKKFKNSCILPLDHVDEVKNEIQIIDNLTYIEKAVNILLGANNKINAINPLDYIYYSLQTYFKLIEKNTPEFTTLEKYINNTSGRDKIVNIFSVSRKEETQTSNKFNDLSNHYLLFHGTKIFNLIGIFSNGLKIAPPEAPMTGYMFGKGIYLSNMYQKSIDYCDTIQDRTNSKKIKNYSYILLCEAALGNIYEPNNKFDIENLHFLNNGYDSLKSLARNGPDPNKNFVCNDGVVIPLGNIINYGNNNTMNMMNACITSYPEYVVYNCEQIKIRYIVQMEKNFCDDYY